MNLQTAFILGMRTMEAELKPMGPYMSRAQLDARIPDIILEGDFDDWIKDGEGALRELQNSDGNKMLVGPSTVQGMLPGEIK